MTQNELAVKAAFQLWHTGQIMPGTKQLAKDMGISEARLRAMAKFIQIKGEPCQFKEIY
jgi:hypothetical protein